MKLYSRKRKNPIKVLVIITLLVGVAFGLSKQFFSSKVDDVIVAQIAEENIYKSEIEKKLNEVFANNSSAKMTFDKLPEQVLEIFAREVFLDRKMVAEAKRLGLDNTLEVKNLIETYKISTIRQAYINNLLKDAVSDQKIVEKFNELNADLESKNEYKYSQIVVRDEVTAKNVLNELKSSKKSLKFADGARKHSIDGHSSVNSGELDFKAESSINPTLLEVLKSMKKDEVSKPIKIDDLWFIIKFIELKKAKPIEFESSKERIRHILKIEEIEKINGKFIKDSKVKLLIKKAPAPSAETNKFEAPEAEAQDKTENKDEEKPLNDQDAKAIQTQ